jgi:hypothetical protein
MIVKTVRPIGKPVAGQNLDLFGRPPYAPHSTLSGAALADKAEKENLRRNIIAFAQLLEPLKLIDLDSIIEKHGTEKWNNSFSTKSQLHTLLYAQFGGLSSLRDLETGMSIFRGELNHLGMSDVPRRSTAAHNNEHRTYEVFESVFHAFLRRPFPSAKRPSMEGPTSSRT